MSRLSSASEPRTNPLSTVSRGPEICGDIPLPVADRRRYLARGLRELLHSFRERVPVEPLRVTLDSLEAQSVIDDGASPLRVYTVALAEQVVPRHVEVEGVICDIGCGGGHHTEHHAKFFEAVMPKSLYLGIDVKFSQGWNGRCRSDPMTPKGFAQMSAEALGLASNSVAFTFSSFALEHLPHVEQVVGEMARTMRPGAYGLHMVPSVWALFLYLFHGYRRFSSGGLVALFEHKGFEVIHVWSLGGAASYLLHGIWITWLEIGAVYDWIAIGRLPGLLRRVGSFYLLRERMHTGMPLRLYAWLLRRAVWLDRFLPFPAVGYGVLVRKPQSA